jgi:hypothetical protein
MELVEAESNLNDLCSEYNFEGCGWEVEEDYEE